jgi:hypothetical protein
MEPELKNFGLRIADFEFCDCQELRAKGDSFLDFKLRIANLEFIEATGKKYSPQRAPRTLSKRLTVKC